MNTKESTELAGWINKIHHGDCLDLLKQLPDNAVDCVVTSPPYYGLRDYGTATWEGGDPECSHKRDSKRSAFGETGSDNVDGGVGDAIYKDNCPKCGAIRIDSQIGLEATPEAYVQKMVEVFEQVRRVLKPEGTCWLNLGDSYAGGSGGYYPNKGEPGNAHQRRKTERVKNLKPKDLIGIPWMCAFALRTAGWWLRQDIIWHKPNPMPEPVTNRCTKSHEYIFLMSKSQRYYYDAEAIKEDSVCIDDIRLNKGNIRYGGKRNGKNGTGQESFVTVNESRNKRSVWTVTTKPFSEAHFATFPEDLIAPCIKAGCPEGGTVLDPFLGSGTTAIVARKLNRNYIGIELSPEYIKIAEKRIQKELGMFL